MIAIEHEGEKMWVHSLDGHEGCTVIAEGVEPSVQPCTICPVTGRAIVDETAAKRQRIKALLRDGRLDEALALI